MHEREGLLGEVYLDLHPRHALAHMRSCLCQHPAVHVSSATSRAMWGGQLLPGVVWCCHACCGSMQMVAKAQSVLRCGW